MSDPSSPSSSTVEVLLPTSLERVLHPADVVDRELDLLYQRVTVLHDNFKRREFEFRLRVGRELLETLYGGRYEDYQDRRRSKSEALSRFFQRHRAALEARELREDALRKYVRVASMVPKDMELPHHVTFSHLLELVALPEKDRAWFFRNKVLKGTVGFGELRSQVRERLADIRATAIDQQEANGSNLPNHGRPRYSRQKIGHVPRRLDGVLSEALAVSRDMAPDVMKRPDVAGEALERWLKIREQADWWVKTLKGEG
jgi:hypothetical protein